MKKKLQTAFHSRQHMLSRDFELYYYEDRELSRVDLHSHNYYEFYFFLEGDVQMQIENEIYPFRYGDILLIPPCIPHRPIIRSHRTPYRRFVFWISQEYYEHLLQFSPAYAYVMQIANTQKRYLFHNDRITFNAVQSKLLHLLEEMRSDHFGKDAKIPLCVDDLVLHINRLVHDQNAPKKKAADSSLYQLLLTYIEEHLDENLSLDKLADEFYVSKYHIAHVFKDNMGLSIHQYITKKRLELCREAIQSKMNIKEAYQMFGFGDYSSFYRAFKKEYGISPKDFRDMQISFIPENSTIS